MAYYFRFLNTKTYNPKPFLYIEQGALIRLVQNTHIRIIADHWIKSKGRIRFQPKKREDQFCEKQNFTLYNWNIF